MLRPEHQGWWRRLISQAHVPAYVLIRSDSMRRCPECFCPYQASDHYCPSCHSAVPEWRFG